MENGAVIETLARQFLEILDRVWRSISPNCTTISPSLVLITATSFDEFMGEGSFFSSATAAATSAIAMKQQNKSFMLANRNAH
jgi:hypothetical protein